MPWELGFKWTEMVGKPWAAYLGAVRTYQPGLNFDVDTPTDHPRAFAERILKFSYNGKTMEEAFEDFLVDKAYERRASKRVNWDPLLFLADARTRVAYRARATAADDTEWRELYEAQIKALDDKVKELEVEAEGYNNDSMEASKERDLTLEENRMLRIRCHSLQVAVTKKTGEDPDTTAPMQGREYRSF